MLLLPAPNVTVAFPDSELKPKLDTLPPKDVHGPADKPYHQRELLVLAPDGELIAFGMITQKLGQPYKITLSVPGARTLVLEPMRSSKALDRAEKLLKHLESL